MFYKNRNTMAGDKLREEGEIYSKDILYWMGYLYRYWHYYTKEDSARIYKQAPVGTMKKDYLMFHTMAPELAIENLLELVSRRSNSHQRTGGRTMIPVIDKKKTGIHLRRIMDARGLSVKDVQQYLELGSVQSVYHWLNGISLPTIDNLYALSELFQVSVDDMLCGNRRFNYKFTSRQNAQFERLRAYYERIQEHKAA